MIKKLLTEILAVPKCVERSKEEALVADILNLELSVTIF